MGFNCLKATEPLQLVVQGGSSFSLILLCALFQLCSPQKCNTLSQPCMGSMCDYVTIWRKQVSCKFHSSVTTTTMNQCSLDQFWFHFNISEVKKGNGRSQRFHSNSSEVKQHSKHTQIFHLIIGTKENSVLTFVRYFILMVVK